mgnify:CR=1 FL=1
MNHDNLNYMLSMYHCVLELCISDALHNLNYTLNYALLMHHDNLNYTLPMYHIVLELCVADASW